ncbi:hypothetical protein FOXB_07937 [Fusarium oxysporum f. sp. conglutinans Fo5176]|uniref:Beta-galactosidase n=1 Tax=Fusarium oxysporum (strain Fo5176) TaxID=660025 RepID=F9FNF7_FUSOF|nr:hypothetical protein FOXB_07937 [Fusarium oxysporum f. sp. conglutinans Fo5176]
MRFGSSVYAGLALLASVSQAKTLTLTATNTSSDLVQWDQHSLFINGSRLIILSGEFHPWRLPSPGLWFDVLQKIKALGYNAVTFYVNWALVEGKEGDLRFNDAFDLQPFINAAIEAGLYLIARPGPYINSELSGGGFPGRLQRLEGELRSTAPDFLNSTEHYVSSVLDIITKAEITNGGPVILVQPENEYSLAVADNPLTGVSNLDPNYMEWVKQQFLRNGVTVPLISNDMIPLGNWAPGTGKGELDIYAHDMYPFYKGCKVELLIHEVRGGVGLDLCAAKIGQDFARVFLKELIARSVKVLNLYMTYGGTNWGNMGHPEGYTSYDHGASIREDRRVDREKCSEAKLQSRWLHASKAYLTAIPQRATHAFVNTDEIIMTPIIGNRTRFYVTRHTQFDSEEDISYRLNLPTSHGDVIVPRLGGDLILKGRDSKIHVTDFDVGGINLIYSSGEIYTWKRYGDKRVLILYGGEGETHEFALPSSLGGPTVEGDNVRIRAKSDMTIINWHVLPDRRVVHFEDLDVYLLWRNMAYNYWVLDLADAETGAIPFQETESSLIVNGGYLMRNATLIDKKLYLTGDLNTTTKIEVISGAPSDVSVFLNGQCLNTAKQKHGRTKATADFVQPSFKLPDLSTLVWKRLDSLPEISQNYSDEAWTEAFLKETTNLGNLTTPKSLYSGDYGYHSGSLLFRGHFTASGNESGFNITVQGGLASGSSVWLGDAFLGSFYGDAHAENQTLSLELPSLDAGHPHVLTVLIDQMGYTMNFYVHSDAMKSPRGVLDYSLDGHKKEDITWRMTGNLRGEDYVDKVRGPYNEGAMFAERNGFHLPGAPTGSWELGSPYQGISAPGVAFYTATFDLDIPDGYDIPLSFVFDRSPKAEPGYNYRVQLFVNGYQFGKYVNNIGPQTKFPVPEGILNYKGENTVALTLWALDEAGARVKGFRLEADGIIQSGYKKPGLANLAGWQERPDAY